jgi:hypothetical protein
MQLYMSNPIRGKKTKINSPKNQKKIEPSLYCQCNIRRDIKIDKRVD